MWDDYECSCETGRHFDNRSMTIHSSSPKEAVEEYAEHFSRWKGLQKWKPIEGFFYVRDRTGVETRYKIRIVPQPQFQAVEV
jgi:hypothetical protein